MSARIASVPAGFLVTEEAELPSPELRAISFRPLPGSPLPALDRGELAGAGDRGEDDRRRSGEDPAELVWQNPIRGDRSPTGPVAAAGRVGPARSLIAAVLGTALIALAAVVISGDRGRPP